MAKELEYVILVNFSFLFLYLFLGGGRLYDARQQFVLDYLDGDFVRTGGACYLDWHYSASLSFVFIFTAARSFALLARGLRTSSWGEAVIGRLVRSLSSAS